MNWVILRGLVREKRHWGEFQKQFEESLAGSGRVLALDLPGFGTEIHRNSPFNVPAIVRDLRERFINECKLSKTENDEWGILAVSLGGMCALSWAEQFPGDFKKVVLINSSLKGLSPIYKRMRPQNFLNVIHSAVTQNLFEREKIILGMTTNLQKGPRENLARTQALFAEGNPPRLRNAVAQLIAAIRISKPKEVKPQVLVISSLGDTLVDPSCSEAIAKYYHADHFIHPTGNHDLSTDDGPWIIEKVNHWAVLSTKV